MISCGEPSGDLYAGALAAEILKLEPDAAITGFGSDRLRAAGASLVGDFKGLSVTGLTEALPVIRQSWRNYRRWSRRRRPCPDVSSRSIAGNFSRGARAVPVINASRRS